MMYGLKYLGFEGSNYNCQGSSSGCIHELPQQKVLLLKLIIAKRIKKILIFFPFLLFLFKPKCELTHTIHHELVFYQTVRAK